MALSLINRLGLYNTIFTDPREVGYDSVDTSNWKKAYDGLQEIMAPNDGCDKGLDCLGVIKSVLLRDSDDDYLAWLLCAFTPWAHIKSTVPEKSMSKAPIPLAAAIAREGIKADNKVTKLVEGAVTNLNEIVASQNTVASQGQDAPTTSPLKRKFESPSRESLGMSIRRWGPRWRNHVMYAVLVGLMEAEDDTGTLKTPCVLQTG